MRSNVAVELARPVDTRAGAVRVRPCGVPAVRRARRVGDRLLAEQQERPLGQAARRRGDRRDQLSPRRRRRAPSRRRALPRPATGSDHRAPSRPSRSPARTCTGRSSRRYRLPRCSPASASSACGITSAITVSAATRSPPARRTPVTRPCAASTPVTSAPVRSAAAELGQVADERVGQAPARRRAGWASRPRARAGSGRRQRSPSRARSAARPRDRPPRRATRARPGSRTAARRAPARSPAAAPRTAPAPTGPALCKQLQRPGQRREPGQHRVADRVERRPAAASTNALHASPSPGRAAFSPSAVRSRSR